MAILVVTVNDTVDPLRGQKRAVRNHAIGALIVLDSPDRKHLR